MQHLLASHRQNRRIGFVISAIMGLFGFIGSAYASPSGLNNTPTADICPVNTLVVQGWGSYGHDTQPDYWTGFKYGVFSNAEIGADWDTSADPSKEVQFQAKYTINFGDSWPKLGLGSANMSGDTKKNGFWMPYAVLSEDVGGLFRIHGGYDFQIHNMGVFGGLDTTVGLLGRDVLFCGDVIQIHNGRDAVFAPGIKFALGNKNDQGAINALLRHLVFETWTTLPTNTGRSVYTAKLNCVIPF